MLPHPALHLPTLSNFSIFLLCNVPRMLLDFVFLNYVVTIPSIIGLLEKLGESLIAQQGKH